MILVSLEYWIRFLKWNSSHNLILLIFACILEIVRYNYEQRSNRYTSSCHQSQNGITSTPGHTSWGGESLVANRSDRETTKIGIFVPEIYSTCFMGETLIHWNLIWKWYHWKASGANMVSKTVLNSPKQSCTQRYEVFVNACI